MKIESLRDLFLHELRDLYSAENQLVKALPKMAEAATNPDLKAAFKDHLKETEGHVERLDGIFKKLDKSAGRETCAAMKGLVEEGSEIIKKSDIEDDARDAALIAAAQRVEHYEMAGYGTVRTYAQLLGEKDLEQLLQATLDEEGDADKKLTNLSETINVDAMEPTTK